MVTGYKQLGLFLFLCYLAFVLYLTLVAWNYGASFEPGEFDGRNYNFHPFRSIFRITFYSPTIYDPIVILLGNIALFIPLGLLLPLLFPSFQTVVRTVTASFLVSLFIEASQFIFTSRVADAMI
ncbi:VanZ family protein [Bacillus sp. JCM 19041]|uniref:VanZ family protein n=1 Tax=Bacillus sp. JCM 19041 TaxID=1460637 RepID=UPI0006CFCBE1